MLGMMPGLIGRVGRPMFKGGGGRPSLDMVFTSDVMDPSVTTARAAGGATEFNSNGNMVLSAANTPRFDHDNVRQLIANVNNSISGQSPNTTTVTTEVTPPLSAGTSVVVKATRAGTGDTNAATKSVTSGSFINNQPMVGSVYVYIPSAWGGTSITATMEGTGALGVDGVANTALRNQWQRLTTTTTPGFSAGNANLVVRQVAGAGEIFYVSGYQIEYGAVATAWQFSSSSVVTTASRGLLVEESRVNSITNARAEGSANGTPGTMPTNWVLTSANGLTSSIIGSGSENGVPYVDMQFTGTTTGTVIRLIYDAVTTTAAAQNQTWTNSSYLRLMAGTFTNVTSVGRLMFTYDAGSVFLNGYGGALALPTSAPLATQRGSQTNTVTDATTAFVVPTLSFATGSGVAVDFTVRIGAPQLELGSFATSAILPAVSTPAATTRAGDVITMSMSALFNATAGTMAAEAMIPAFSPAGVFPDVLRLDDSSNANQFKMFMNQAATGFTTINATVTQVNTTNGTAVAGIVFKEAMAWSASRQAYIGPGAAVASTAFATNPTGINRMLLSPDGARYMRRIRYWPRALSNAELQSVTT